MKRKIFSLAGYDPRGAQFYYALFQEQVERHNARDAANPIVVSKRVRAGYCSEWNARTSDKKMHTDFTFLGWDDVVRAHWPQGVWALLFGGISTYFHLMGYMNKRFFLAMPRYALGVLSFPIVCFLVPLSLMMSAALFFLPSIVLQLVGVAVSLGAEMLIMHTILKHSHNVWLLRNYIFNDQLARGTVKPIYTERMAAFTRLVHESLSQDYDEILLIAHSNGGLHAVPIVATLLEVNEGALPKSFALVTLGSSLQFLSARKDARTFAAALATLSVADFTWLDIGSLTDAACLALQDPYAFQDTPKPQGLKQLSPRWFKYADPTTYAARRKDKYNTHFDYLRTLDKPSPLDYIGLTCSAHKLADSLAAFERENSHD
jgi:hypothetical protein